MELIYSLEDDLDISKIINKTLSKAGYEIESFYDGKSFLEAFNLKRPSMVILDLMLPDMPGLDVLKKIREIDKNVYVVILSAKRMVTDKVDGYDLGADDYIEKPFDILEFISRVNAHFRRIEKNPVINQSGITLDSGSHTCFYEGKEIFLTLKEFAILRKLLENYGKVVSRNELLNEIWGNNNILETRTIDMHVKSIRKKIPNSNIETIYGVGYRLV